MIRGDDLLIELDGDGVAPDAVDAGSLLRIATSVLDIVEKLAVEKGRTVQFNSLNVLDKCVAIAVGSSDPDVLKSVVPEVELVLVGDRPVPRGTQRSVETLRVTLRKLPPGHHVKLLQRETELPLVIRDLEEPTATSITSFRATLVKVGGKSPAAQFRSAFQERITLGMSRDLAIRIGALLYKEMDIVARVSYTHEFDIKKGTLLDFKAVDDLRDPVAELRAWYQEAKRHADFDNGET